MVSFLLWKIFVLKIQFCGLSCIIKFLFLGFLLIFNQVAIAASEKNKVSLQLNGFVAQLKNGTS